MIGGWERVLVLAPHTDDGEFGDRVRGRVEREGGNREVPPPAIRRVPGDMRGRRASVYLEEEGGAWGKHGFPHANSPSEVRG
jgi:hypothetical protein